MTPNQARIIGFLMHCREQGMEPPQMKAAMEKVALVGEAASAARGVGSAATTGASGAFDLAKWLGQKAIWGLAAGPPLIGAGIGYTAAHLGGPDQGPEDASHEEQVDAYRQAIAELNRIKKQQQRLQPNRGRAFA